jgi:hypothetical protein
VHGREARGQGSELLTVYGMFYFSVDEQHAGKMGADFERSR